MLRLWYAQCQEPRKKGEKMNQADREFLARAKEERASALGRMTLRVQELEELQALARDGGLAEFPDDLVDRLVVAAAQLNGLVATERLNRGLYALY
jgi:hypothetical protein